MSRGKIGISTTIPVEVVYAAGYTPVDLNNIFITSEDRADRVAEAEFQGYPRNACGWIKGIYSTALNSDLEAVIAVVEGDCSQTCAMMETLQMHGMRIIPFAFPYGRDRDLLRMQIEKLIGALGTTWEDTLHWKRRLDAVRRLVWELDNLTWKRGSLTGSENSYYSVCCSDFNGDPDEFEREVTARLQRARAAEPQDSMPRLGYIGIPTIFTDFYEYVESQGVRVVFNEVQRQFTMPFETDDIVEQYALYTYPYDIFYRLQDIQREIERRRLDGLVHYTQSFCYRQIQDLIVRKNVDLPVLTLEGDTPTDLDARTRVRIESFVEMLNAGMR